MFYRKEESEEEAEEGELNEKDLHLHPLVTVSNINPDDIPDVPVNKFLMRGGNAKEKVKG